MTQPRRLYDADLLQQLATNGLSLGKIGQRLGLSRHTVKRAMLEIGLTPPSNPIFQKVSDDDLRQWVEDGNPASWMAEKSGRSHQYIVDRLTVLGLSGALKAGHPRHPIDESAFRRMASEGTSCAAIARYFGTSDATILRRAKMLGIQLQKPEPYIWNDAQLCQWVKEGKSCRWMAEQIPGNPDDTTVQWRLAKLGLRSTAKAPTGDGQDAPHWKGGVLLRRSGYILRYAKGHPFANSLGYVPEHRLIMEKKIGRYLLPEEVVHHENCVRDDNRIENLRLMTANEHRSLHATIRHQRAREKKRQELEAHASH